MDLAAEKGQIAELDKCLANRTKARVVQCDTSLATPETRITPLRVSDNLIAKKSNNDSSVYKL